MGAHSHRSRLRTALPAWLGGQVASDRMSDDDGRRVWSDIAAWLDEHGLDPSPANYAVAHAFVTGDAPAGPSRIGEGLSTPAATSDDARVRDPQAISPELLIQMAEALETKLGEALGIVGQQVTSARDYGDALDSEVREAEADPVGAFGRLIAMTREVVAATRLMEGQLEATRRDAAKLRSDLTSARRAADRDHLTGLPNRRFFDTRLASKASAKGCLALCDIDDFKRINDAHGHETGDRVLRFVAKALRDELNGQALVARYGGEEFACLFESADLLAAKAALDRMRERLKARSLVDRSTGAPLGRLTFSAGLAIIDGQPRDALRAADEALYAAKRAGKDRVEAIPRGSGKT